MPEVKDRWVLVVQDGVDTLHRNAREECNLDDSTSDQAIDFIAAERMLLSGEAVPCGHCLANWG